MGLNLHPSLKARLVMLLEGILPEVRVERNSFLAVSNLPDLRPLDAVFPDGKSTTRRSLNAFIGETPFQSFLIGVLSAQLAERPFDPDATETPLTALPEYNDVNALASRLVDRFDALPDEYEVLIHLRHPAGTLFRNALLTDELTLTPRFALVRIPEHGSPFALDDPTDFPPLFSRSPSGVHPGGIYAKVNVSGYIPIYGGSGALEEASFMVRAFLGLCFAQRILTRAQALKLGGPFVHHLLVYHRGVDAPATLQSTHKFSPELSDALDQLGIDQIYQRFSEEHLPRALRADLSAIGIAMDHHHTDERLLRAAQWLFDSNAGSNAQLAFVQAMISLEILLGDKTESDLLGLGALLGNRCAFMVGKTRTQREKILTDFRRIYDTRSRIVHNGHNRLSAQEENDFWTLRWLCSRVIQEEMTLLMADTQPPTA